MEEHDWVAFSTGVDVRYLTIQDGYAPTLEGIRCGDVGLGHWGPPDW
jgi:hypothetical protein